MLLKHLWLMFFLLSKFNGAYSCEVLTSKDIQKMKETVAGLKLSSNYFMQTNIIRIAIRGLQLGGAAVLWGCVYYPEEPLMPLLICPINDQLSKVKSYQEYLEKKASGLVTLKNVWKSIKSEDVQKNPVIPESYMVARNWMAENKEYLGINLAKHFKS